MVKGSRQPSQAPPKSPQKANRLKRDTPFICNVKFRNSLPEVPCDPKMLVAVLQPEKLAAFAVTTLEREMRQDLILEPDLGIPISLLDTQRYAVPDHRPPLAPEDAALLAGPSVGGGEGLTGTGPGKARERLRGEGTELSWLMRTTYIAAEANAERKQAAADDAGAADAAAPGVDLDTQIAEIEAGFEHARTPPVHQRDPSLTAAEILPVLPDMERWRDSYVLMVFDGEPTADHKRIARLPADEAKRIAEHAVVKSYTLKGEQNGKEDRFVAYMLPAHTPPDRDAGAPSTSRAETEEEYEWVREYNYRVNSREEGRKFWFQFQKDRVTYADLNTSLNLMKRSKLITGQSFPRPSKVIVKRRPRNEAEEDVGRKRLRDLTGTEQDFSTVGVHMAAEDDADNGWVLDPDSNP